MAFYDSVPQNLQRPVGYLIALFVLGLVLAAFGFAFYYFAFAWDKAFDTEFPRQISVQGEGKVAVKPDIAVFSAGVVTSSEKIKNAQDENTKKSNAIAEFLKQQGIEAKDVKTVGYNINPQYQYDNRPCIQIYPSPCSPPAVPKIASYEVRHTLEIKVRDLGKVDELLEGVVVAGANEVGSVQFKVDDEEKVLAEARKKAIEDARSKAKVLAKDLDVRLTKIVSFSESGGPIFGRFEALGKGGDGFGGAVPTPQVEPGEQEIRSFVNVVYEFR